MKKLSKVSIGVGIYLASGNVIFFFMYFLQLIFSGLFHFGFPGVVYSVMGKVTGGFLPWWVVSYGSIIFLIVGFVGLIITDERIVEKKYFNPTVITGAILFVIMILTRDSLSSFIRSYQRNVLLIICGSYLVRTISFVLIIVGYKNLLRADKEETLKENTISANIETSYFDGGLLQLIGWSILGFLVTIFTLGICFPWALCMIYGWETNHTVIEGRRLRFTGKAISLFGYWLLWGLLTIITLGIYSFWLRISLKKWITKNTIFANELLK